MNDIPYGYCQCGCGEKTWIATQTNNGLGWVRGQPVRFCHGHHERARAQSEFLARFWGHVDRRGPNDCWVWTGRRGASGYGVVSVGSHPRRAHRVSYEIAYGPIPDGLYVCHACDNPPCVNPTHLWLGSARDNSHDARDKGRSPFGDRSGAHTHPESRPRGEAHYAARVTEADVVAIRAAFAAGEGRAALSRRYGVTYEAISAIVRRLSWRHVP